MGNIYEVPDFERSICNHKIGKLPLKEEVAGSGGHQGLRDSGI